jgi:polar amino acid transport system permease protein
LTYTFNFRAVFNNFDLLLEGAWLTIQLSALVMLLGFMLGVVVALARAWGPRPLRWIAISYVEIIRNTPLIVQLFIVFFGLPSLGVRLSAGEAAVLSLTINLGAYATEIVRAGIDAIHRSQIEAGLSLGLSRLQVFRHVVLFPALQVVYPALTSQFVLLMLATSVVSQVAAKELFNMGAFIESRTFRSFEIYGTIALMYLAMSLGFRALFALLHRLVFTRR